MSQIGLLCLIGLSEMVDLRPAAVARAIGAASPRSSVAVEPRPCAADESAVAITLDNHPLVAVAIEGRMPEPELGQALRHSLFWSGAAAEMGRHTAFVALAAAEPARGHGLVRAQAVALTRAAAGLVELTPALGVYWRGAEAAVPPGRIAEAPGQIDQDRWPADVWIGYRHYGRLDGAVPVLGVQSLGAAAYLGFELEVPPFACPDRAAPLRILWNAIGYLLARGDTLRDGQQVEVTGERRTLYRLHLGPQGRTGLARLEVIGG